MIVKLSKKLLRIQGQEIFENSPVEMAKFIEKTLSRGWSGRFRIAMLPPETATGLLP
jgi:hypothetical protein